MKHVTAFLGTAVSLVVLGCSGAGPDGAEPAAVAEDIEGVPVADPVAEKPAVEEVVDRVDDRAAAPAVSFVPAQGFDGVGGTWRGQVYSEPHAGYYEFTAHIVRPSLNQPELTGSLVARSWQGTRDDVAPPDVCAEGAFHWTVVENGAGLVHDDGAVSFAGTSWAVGDHFCGERVTDYSFDHLDMVAPGGDMSDVSKLTGRASDAVVWVGAGLPIELTRISCE